MKIATITVLSLGLALLILTSPGCQQPTDSGADAEVQAPASKPPRKTVQKDETAAERLDRIKAKFQAEKPGPKKAEPKKSVPRDRNAGYLSADKNKLDFGLVDPGQKVKGEFILTNNGKKTLKISKADSSCGCTVAKLKTKTLEPGQSVPLAITFTAPTKATTVTKKVWVITEAPALPEKLEMKVTAKVQKYIDVKPARLEFEKSSGSGSDATVVLESTRGESFRIKSTNSSRQALEVTFDPKNKATRHELPINIDRKKMKGLPRGNLTLTLSHPKSKTITIPFSIVPPFQAHPATRAFLNAQPGKPQKSTISVTSNYEKDFELGEVTSQKGLVTVESIKKQKDSYQIVVVMTPPADSKARIYTDHLIINIKDHPDDTLKVYCYGRKKTKPSAKKVSSK